MELNLEGKVALVTGGMSGLGRAIVQALLDEGGIVQVADLRPEAGTFGNRHAQLHELDVGDCVAVQTTVERILQAQGRLDILVNCAGILKTRPLVESSFADWDEVARVNLAGVYYCSLAVLPSMVAARYGKIVNIASVSAAKGGGQFGNVLYGTTKAGVVAMTQGFARELGPWGINVNAISPGVVDTPMTAGLMTGEVRDAITQTIPLRRLIEPSEIATHVAYLASDVTKGITGQTVAVDAGFLVR